MLDLINYYPGSCLTVLDIIHESGTFIGFRRKKLGTFRFTVQLSCTNIPHKLFNKIISLKTEVHVQNLEVASMNLKAPRQTQTCCRPYGDDTDRQSNEECS